MFDGALDGQTNMDRDRDLLANAESGVTGWRIYRWSEPTVSLGMFQSPERDLVASCTIPWVMRPTGGKAVLHGHDETVAIAVPLGCFGCDPRALRSIYRAVTAPLVAALNACGLPATLGENTRFAGQGGPRTADCFAHVSANDIVDPLTGQKVCGCALRLTERAVLVQASIPNGPPKVDPQTVFLRPASAFARNWNGAHLVGALRDALSREPWS